jgi:hypothetical protein
MALTQTLVAKITVELALEPHYLYICLDITAANNLIPIPVSQEYPVHIFRH